MGAWIETVNRNVSYEHDQVAPLVGAWIETSSAEALSASASVAPLVGAWIETLYNTDQGSVVNVAPLVGAWIETFLLLVGTACLLSHPSWVRGLKPYLTVFTPSR